MNAVIMLSMGIWTQQTRGADPMVFKRWPTVADGGANV